MKTTFKITELTHTELSDFLLTALLHSFWANVDYDVKDKEGVEIQTVYYRPYVEEILASLLLNGKTITIIDKEDGQEYKLDLETLLNAFNNVAKSEAYHRCVWSIITENYNRSDADIVLQFAIFGKKRYA